MTMVLGLHCLQWLSGKVMLQLSCEGMLQLSCEVMLQLSCEVMLQLSCEVMLQWGLLSTKSGEKNISYSWECKNQIQKNFQAW